jgi:protocatechuate 3,4-dioxygenase alpha subunit
MTPSQTIGPFYHFGLTPNDSLGCLVPDGAAGERIRLSIRLLDGDGAPVPDGMIELWQPDVPCFGRLATDAEGVCAFETVRSPHLNVIVFARGLNHHLFTRIYFVADPADPVLALVPKDRRATLIARAEPAGSTCWRFDIRLQGAEETVFFDL